MAGDTGGPSLDELIERALEKTNSSVCWAAKLPEGLATKYIERLEAIEHEEEGKVNKAAVARILMQEFGIRTSKETVRRHFRRECRCHG